MARAQETSKAARGKKAPEQDAGAAAVNRVPNTESLGEILPIHRIRLGLLSAFSQTRSRILTTAGMRAPAVRSPEPVEKQGLLGDREPCGLCVFRAGAPVRALGGALSPRMRARAGE